MILTFLCHCFFKEIILNIFRALFPCGDNMVCIIDDREDVWSHASNLIHVKPYHFFQHTGDINAPPGLDKHEQDDKEGLDLSKIVNNIKKANEESNEVNKVKTKCKEQINEKPSDENDNQTGVSEVVSNFFIGTFIHLFIY